MHTCAIYDMWSTRRVSYFFFFCYWEDFYTQTKQSDWTEASFLKPDLPTPSQPVGRCLCAQLTVRRLWVWIHCQLALSVLSLHVVLMPVWVMSGYLVILKRLGVSVSDCPSLCWPRPSRRDNLQSRIILLSKFISEQKTLYKVRLLSFV